MSKPFSVQYVSALSSGLLIAGILLLIVGIADVIGVGFKELGGWGFWLLGAGAIVLLIGAIWFYTYVASVRKFRKLMGEKSKAAFVKKLDDVEYLAWKLPMKYESQLSVKKKEFGIR
jgi:hypothetical protein